MRGGGRVEKGGNLKEIGERFLKVFFHGGFDTVFTRSNVKFGFQLTCNLDDCSEFFETATKTR